MKDVKSYITNALKESLNTCDKEKLDYYYGDLTAEDYFSAYKDDDNLYDSADEQDEYTKVCSWEDVEDVWAEVLESVLIDFVLVNMSDDDLEDGVITEEFESVFDCESNYLGERFSDYNIPAHTDEILAQQWGEFDSNEYSQYNAAERIVSYLYERGKIGTGAGEVALAGIAKFFGATHQAVLEATDYHGSIYSFYRFKTCSFSFDREIKSAVERACYDEEGANMFGGWFLPVWISVDNNTDTIKLSFSDICSRGTIWNGDQPLYKIDVWHTYWQPGDAEQWAYECNNDPENFNYDEIHEQDIEDAVSEYDFEVGDLTHYADGQEYVIVSEVLIEENKKDYPELYAICEAAASWGYGRVDLD